MLSPGQPSLVRSRSTRLSPAIEPAPCVAFERLTITAYDVYGHQKEEDVVRSKKDSYDIYSHKHEVPLLYMLTC